MVILVKSIEYSIEQEDIDAYRESYEEKESLTDEEIEMEINESLPQRIVIYMNSQEEVHSYEWMEELTSAISDKTGWCVNNYEYFPVIRLSHQEFNAILDLTNNTLLDQSFDLVEFAAGDLFVDFDNDDEGWDYEGHHVVDIETGLRWLLDGIAYPLIHDVSKPEYIDILVNLFSRYGLIDKEQTEWLKSSVE